jgi:hypothetical protein
MSKTFNEDKLYSKETVQYLHERGLDYKIQENYRKFGKNKPHANSAGDIDVYKILAEADVEAPEAPANPVYVDGTNISTGEVVPDNDGTADSQTETQAEEPNVEWDLEHLQPPSGDYSLDEFDQALREQVEQLSVKDCQDNLKDLEVGPKTGTLPELRWRVAKAVQLAEQRANSGSSE